MVDMRTLKLGDRVIVNSRGNGRVEGVVTEIEIATEDRPEGIKNGVSGICYDIANGDSFWCYHNQIERKL